MDFAIDDSSSVDRDKVLFLFPDPDSFLPSIASLSVRLVIFLCFVLSHIFSEIREEIRRQNMSMVHFRFPGKNPL
jgi:hypothetical protein